MLRDLVRNTTTVKWQVRKGIRIFSVISPPGTVKRMIENMVANYGGPNLAGLVSGVLVLGPASASAWTRDTANRLFYHIHKIIELPPRTMLLLHTRKQPNTPTHYLPRTSYYCSCSVRRILCELHVERCSFSHSAPREYLPFNWTLFYFLIKLRANSWKSCSPN